MKKIKGKQIESVTAEQVTMPNKLIITKSVGEITVNAGGVHEISPETEDGRVKTAWELFQEIFSKDNQPTITNQTLKITNQTAQTSVEIGTKVTPKIKITTTPGSYTYDAYPNGGGTGVTFNNCTATISYGSTSKTKDNVATDGTIISFDECTPTSNIVANASAYNTAGANAKTQLGNDSGLHINAGTTSATQVTLVTVYRNYFYGATGKTIDELKADIRSIGTKSNKAAAVNAKVTIPITNTTQKLVFIAVPKNAAAKGINVLKRNGEQTDPMTSSFVSPSHQPETISVAGNNNYEAIDYLLYTAAFDAVGVGDHFEITLIAGANN